MKATSPNDLSTFSEERHTAFTVIYFYVVWKSSKFNVNVSGKILPRISSMEMESAAEIFCTQDTKMTADRRNNKTLVDAITEYKTVFPMKQLWCFQHNKLEPF